MADDLEAVIEAEVAKAEAGEIDIPGVESGFDEGDEAEVETPPVEEKPVEGEKKAEEPPKEEDLDFEKVPALDQRKRENRIPHKDVKRIVTTAEKRLAALVLGKDPDSTKPFADQVKAYVARIPELETKVKAYEDEVAPMRTLGNVMATDGAKFLKILESAYPQVYGELLKPKAPPAQESFKPDFTTMPEPDYKLPDGSMTYSLEGNKKLMEWNNQQLITKLRAEAKAEVEATNKPLKDRMEAQKQIEISQQRVATKVAEARTWDGFKEHEADIIAVINKATNENRALPIEMAYAQVMNEKRKSAEAQKEINREAMRQELIKEIKAAPLATSVGSNTADTKAVSKQELSEEDGGDDPVTAAIIKSVREYESRQGRRK